MKKEILTCDICKKDVSQFCHHIPVNGSVSDDLMVFFNMEISFSQIMRDAHGSNAGTWEPPVDICYKCAEKLFLMSVKQQFEKKVKL